MRFKTDKQLEDVNTLAVKNPKLYQILHMLEDFCTLEFKKDICVTDVYRTPADLAEIYKEVPKPWPNSPHLYWNAFDLRSTDFIESERIRMLQFLNSFSYTSGQGKPVSFIHAITGNVMHFHVQAN